MLGCPGWGADTGASFNRQHWADPRFPKEGNAEKGLRQGQIPVSPSVCIKNRSGVFFCQLGYNYEHSTGIIHKMTVFSKAFTQIDSLGC